MLKLLSSVLTLWQLGRPEGGSVLSLLNKDVLARQQKSLPSSVGMPGRSVTVLSNFTSSDLISPVLYGTVTDVSSNSLSLSDGLKSSYYFSMQH
jgi:hypothetical protein